MITTAKKKPSTSKVSIKDVWFFDKDGKKRNDKRKLDDKNSWVSENDGECYAKTEIFTDNKKVCYIKVHKAGRVGEYVVDPISLLGRPSDMYGTSDAYGCRFCEYRTVPEEVFHQYLHYLEKKTSVHLKEVERWFLTGGSA